MSTISASHHYLQQHIIQQIQLYDQWRNLPYEDRNFLNSAKHYYLSYFKNCPFYNVFNCEGIEERVTSVSGTIFKNNVQHALEDAPVLGESLPRIRVCCDQSARFSLSNAFKKFHIELGPYR